MQRGLERTLRLRDLIVIVVGTVIGSGPAVAASEPTASDTRSGGSHS